MPLEGTAIRNTKAEKTYLVFRSQKPNPYRKSTKYLELFKLLPPPRPPRPQDNPHTIKNFIWHSDLFSCWPEKCDEKSATKGHFLVWNFVVEKKKQGKETKLQKIFFMMNNPPQVRTKLYCYQKKIMFLFIWEIATLFCKRRLHLYLNFVSWNLMIHWLKTKVLESNLRQPAPRLFVSISQRSSHSFGRFFL